MGTVAFDVVISGLIGFAIGAVLMGIISYSNKGKKSAEHHNLQKEFDAYRERVNAHFAKTADAIDGLNKSYKQVFDHLSDGAQNLMDKKALQAQLEKRQGKAVTLAYLVDEKDVAKAEKVSQIKASSVVDQPVNKPVAAKPAAPATAAVSKPADTVKTPSPAVSGKADDVKHSAAAVKPEVADKPVSPSAAAPVNPAVAPVKPVSETEKSNAQKAAEKAGIKPATAIVDNKEHETAIDSVKKHIKDDKGSKA